MASQLDAAATRPPPPENEKNGNRNAWRQDHYFPEGITLDELPRYAADSHRMLIALRGEVIDVTDVADKHPAGRRALELVVGVDATEAFNRLHGNAVLQKVGRLAVARALPARVRDMTFAQYRTLAAQETERDLSATRSKPPWAHGVPGPLGPNGLAGVEAPGALLLAVDGNVYNIAGYTRDHPGGEHILRRFVGGDASAEFARAEHSGKALESAKRRLVGRISDWPTTADHLDSPHFGCEGVLGLPAVENLQLESAGSSMSSQAGSSARAKAAPQPAAAHEQPPTSPLKQEKGRQHVARPSGSSDKEDFTAPAQKASAREGTAGASCDPPCAVL